MKNNKRKEIKRTNAVNFLMYSYFGITLDSTAEEILDTAIHKAYLDAAQQGAYNALLKTEQQKALSKNAHEEGKTILAGRIKIFCSSQTEQSRTLHTQFNSWHSCTCSELTETYRNYLKTSELFTYGNAQKWVNMTLKYLYILNSIFSEFSQSESKVQKNDYCDKLGRPIAAFSDQLHVPVDSYIIEAVWNLETENNMTETILPLIKNKLCKNGRRGTYASDKVKPWSKWQKEEYEIFQAGLKEMVHDTPIDWEAPVWIEIARKRKG